MGAIRVTIGEDFGPAPGYKRLFYITLFVIMLLGFLIWYVPLLFFVPAWIMLIIGTPFFLAFILALIWIPKYYKTVLYRLTENEMVWRRGVWFRKTGIVPYNRITNIDIEQGPVSRKLGIGSLKIQTAGYSGAGGGTGHPAEIRIEGVVHFEELREAIMGFVRGMKPVGAAGVYEQPGDPVLEELVKIRKLLEKRR
jgi:membrane protein YdbS with pleckstrin-like domain